MYRCARLRVAAAFVLAVVVFAPGDTHAAITAERILAGLDQPIFVTAAPSDPRLFVVLRGGTVRIYENGQLLATPFLDVDLSTTVLLDGEGGLLSIAFPPDFSFAGGDYVYAYYSIDPPGQGTYAMQLSRFPLLAGMETVRADESMEEVLYTIEKTETNHNGGTIAFRGDWLYLGLGDGGGGGDPMDFAQDDASDFGKMLRFNPSLAGTPPWSADHWAKGLRNPYRFSFDAQTGDLYIGDVGQNAEEEIDVQDAAEPSGENFGWDVHEGDSCFDPSPGEPECDDPSLTFPVHRYDQIGGTCGGGGSGSVTGGYVYRGSAVPEIAGHYFFADYCTDEIWSLVWDGAGGIVGNVVPRTGELVPDQGTIESIVSFGQDSAGELYIVDIGGEVFQVPEPTSGSALGFVLAALVSLARRQRLAGRWSDDAAATPRAR